MCILWRPPAETSNIRLLFVIIRYYTMARKSPINFEKALSQLEQLVEDMEQGDLSLDEALKHFEKGISLAADCQQALNTAEQKVSQLIEKNGELLEKPFEIDD